MNVSSEAVRRPGVGSLSGFSEVRHDGALADLAAVHDIGSSSV